MAQGSTLFGLILVKKVYFEYEKFKIKAMYSSGYSFSKQGFPVLRPLCVAGVRFIPLFSCEAGV